MANDQSNQPQPLDLSQFGGSQVQPAGQSSAPPSPTTPNAPLDLSSFGGKQVTPAPPQPSLGDKIIQGVKQSFIGQAPGQIADAWHGATDAPRDSREHAVWSVGGPGGLIAYRAGKELTDQAEKMFEAKPEEFRQHAKMFQKAAGDFHNRDYRSLASDLGTLVGGQMNLDPTKVPGFGERISDLSEGARPGGNLATPITRDVLDLGTLALDSDTATKAKIKATGAVKHFWDALPDVKPDSTPAEHLATAKKNLYSAMDPTKGMINKGIEDKLDAALPQVHEALKNAKDVKTPMDAADAIEAYRSANEERITNIAKQYGADPKAIMNGTERAVETAVDNALSNREGSWDPKVADVAKQNVMSLLRQGEGAEPSELNLKQAENLRKTWKEETNKAYAPNAPTAPGADIVAKDAAVRTLRSQINDKYEELGVPGVKAWRAQEAPLIDVRDALYRARASSEAAGKWGLLQTAWKTKGVSLLPLMLGFEWGGLTGGASMLAGELGLDYLRDKITNPNLRTQRAVESFGKAGPSGAVVPMPGAPSFDFTKSLNDKAFSGEHFEGNTYTDEGLRKTFGIPNDVSLQDLERQGKIKFDPQAGGWNVSEEAETGLGDHANPNKGAGAASSAPTLSTAAEGPQWERTVSGKMGVKDAGKVGYKIDPEGNAQVFGSVVPKEFRGKGIGTELYKKMIADAKATGAKVLKSDSTNTTPAALRVWEKLAEQGYPIEPIVHADGKPGFQIKLGGVGENGVPKTVPALPFDQIKTQAKDLAESKGIEFRGIQEGVQGLHPGMAIFQDPESGMSIAVRLNEWSPERVQEQLDDARKRMGIENKPVLEEKPEVTDAQKEKLADLKELEKQSGKPKDEEAGNWFTPEINYADIYKGPSEKVYAVDVPKDTFKDSAYSSEVIPRSGGKIGHIHLLPKDWSGKAQPVESLGQVPEGMTRLYRSVGPDEQSFRSKIVPQQKEQVKELEKQSGKPQKNTGAGAGLAALSGNEKPQASPTPKPKTVEDKRVKESESIPTKTLKLDTVPPKKEEETPVVTEQSSGKRRTSSLGELSLHNAVEAAGGKPSDTEFEFGGNGDVSQLLEQASHDSGVPSDILHAVAQQESGMNSRALSNKGAKGVMQLMDSTAQRLGVKDSYNPNENVPAGARYLAQLHSEFKHWDQALAAYNWGPDNVRNAVDKFGVDWLDHAPRETRHYVRAILAQREK